MTKFFIAVNANEANQLTIDGIGHTADEAIADAVRGSGVGSNDIEDGVRHAPGPVIERDRYGDPITVHFVAEECTQELYDVVDADGGARLRWAPNEQGLQDVAKD